jgi:hypothetical protein
LHADYQRIGLGAGKGKETWPIIALYLKVLASLLDGLSEPDILYGNHGTKRFDAIVQLASAIAKESQSGAVSATVRGVRELESGRRLARIPPTHRDNRTELNTMATNKKRIDAANNFVVILALAVESLSCVSPTAHAQDSRKLDIVFGPTGIRWRERR